MMAESEKNGRQSQEKLITRFVISKGFYNLNWLNFEFIQPSFI